MKQVSASKELLEAKALQDFRAEAQTLKRKRKRKQERRTRRGKNGNKKNLTPVVTVAGVAERGVLIPYPLESLTRLEGGGGIMLLCADGPGEDCGGR